MHLLLSSLSEILAKFLQSRYSFRKMEKHFSRAQVLSHPVRFSGKAMGRQKIFPSGCKYPDATIINSYFKLILLFRPTVLRLPKHGFLFLKVERKAVSVIFPKAAISFL